MKRSLSAVGLAASLLVPVAAQAATPDGYLDQICPEATGAVREFNVKTKNPATSLDEGLGITENVIVVYQKCAGEKQRKSESNPGLVSSSDNTGVEGMHYAQIRAAFYQLALGRLLVALRRYDDARIVFNQALRACKDTLDWRAPAVQSYSSNSINVKGGSMHDVRSAGSDYRGAATYVHDQAVAELEKLPKPETPASPQPAVAPK
ncbi:MAG: hypothetical protein GIW95_07135 [Candidatus Eremiobacteraeota bacterium]|nr:hypothetical protein [Candidatus Eremiobacteraeota bacterium]